MRNSDDRELRMGAARRVMVIGGLLVLISAAVLVFAGPHLVFVGWVPLALGLIGVALGARNYRRSASVNP